MASTTGSATGSHYTADQMAMARSFQPLPPVKTDENRNLELPASAYRYLNHVHAGTEEFKPSAGLPRRQNYNTQGKQVVIRVNQFKVTDWPENSIAQFDIKVTHHTGNVEKEPTNDGLIKKMWNCAPVKDWREKTFDKFWIFDGKKIAWNRVHMKKNKNGVCEHTIRVNLDEVHGHTPRPEDANANTYNITFKQTTFIRMQAIKAFLDQTMDFTNDVFEAINFLDHVLRQTPTEKYAQVRRSFYTWDARISKQDILNTQLVDPCVELMRGVYASIRLCHRTGDAKGLAVNLDVANGLFWLGTSLLQMLQMWLRGHVNAPFARDDYAQIARNMLPVWNHAKKEWQWSESFKELRRFFKLKFTVSHRREPKGAVAQTYTIKRFVINDQQMNKDGANSKNTMFDWKQKNGAPARRISIYDFFRERYNITLRHWQLPCVESTKGGTFPIEVCDLKPEQRYPFKTTPDQTAKMIKMAVQRPPKRMDAIRHGLNMLNWSQDPYLKHYGIKIDNSMTETQARLLTAPQLQYKGKKLNPGVSGKWMLKDIKFLIPNSQPLQSWGILVMNSCCPLLDIQNFAKAFINSYVGHGGVVPTKQPIIRIMPREGGPQMPDMIANFRQEVGNAFKMAPQMIMVVLPDSNNQVYERLKRNLEGRWGIVSQMMQAKHMKKASPQYCSNVCMKFNAKLGGTTNTIAGREKDGGTNWFGNKRTMLIGADISHPGHGSPQASIAAITVNADKGCMRYWAACAANGPRVEMIKESNMEQMLMGFFPRWVKDVGQGYGPDHIYYFRDGVSEGQYDHVLEQEVKAMKASILKKYPTAKCRFVVVICSKRHKIRFFPKDNDKQAGDLNGNPHPGTLVERDVTHPFEHDFYLSSHSAIQGTARPTHYHVILDEVGVNVNDLHNMVYQHCYQFMRSTTPVSLYPAVYYAHLAAARARAHENIPYSLEMPRTGQKFDEYKQDKELREANMPQKAYGHMNELEKIAYNQSKETEKDIVYPPLTGLGSGSDARTADAIKHSMWYI